MNSLTFTHHHQNPRRRRFLHQRLHRSLCAVAIIVWVVTTSKQLLNSNIITDYDYGSTTLKTPPKQNNENAANTENHAVKMMTDKIIFEMREVVTSHLNMQTGSWFRYLGAYRTESEPESSIRRTKANSLAISTSEPASIPVEDGIIWDDEDDIPSYFDVLHRSCRQTNDSDPASVELLKESCLRYFYNLVHQPRCTVRLDSRTKCSSSSRTSKKSSLDIHSILGPDQHFSKDSINIVIIGAGPVGQFLANALNKINNLRANETGHLPIRIVVFENRIWTDGHKKAYSRTWMTGIDWEAIADTIDDRIRWLLYAFFRNGPLEWPINYWETLLLLSNRDRGGKQPLKYAEFVFIILTFSIPVMFFH